MSEDQWSTDGPTSPEMPTEDYFPPASSSSIKLIKNTKGYNWEIKIYNEDVNQMIKDIDKANRVLKVQYGEKNG